MFAQKIKQAGARWRDRGARLARFDRPTWRRALRRARWPLAAGAALVLAVLVSFVYIYATVELPEDRAAPSSSVVLDANGIEIATISGDELRKEVSLDDVSPTVVDALIAAEDRRFYDHSGVDGFGIVRATFNNLRGNELQGGSTLTQQLVKNAFLSSDRTISRKVKEAVLAIKLEREMSKDEILETYLNTVYFGRGAYGIEAAAEVYFDTTAAELDLAQSAYLVGALQSPERLDPLDNPDDAKSRRAEVLTDMVENDAITQAEADEAAERPFDVLTADSPVELGEGAGAHFIDWVHQQTDELIAPGAATSRGLVIETTLDLEDQVVAEAAVAEVLTEAEDPEAALVAVDETGAIRALVGSRDHEKLKVNLALGAEGGGAGRQPGSTFKPVALMAGLEDGMSIRQDFQAPGTITVETEGGPYEVANYDSADKGVIDLEEATVGSVNTVYAQVAAEVGGEALADVAERGGVDAPLEPLPSLALGAGEVSPLDMADLFSSFARRGEHIEPFAIARILDSDGEVLYEHEAETDRVFEQERADTLNHVLQQAVERGTGTAAKIDRPIAGKTGTTQDFGDAWFAGYAPNYTAVVWMGYPEGQSRGMTDVHGQSVTGGSFPAEIWKRFATGALQDVEVVDFAPPPDDALQDPDERTLTIANAGEIRPGDEVVAEGSGFELCTAGWGVAVAGTDLASPMSPGDGDERQARVRLPDDFSPGEYRMIARCDDGDGPTEVASALFEVVDPDSESTTTSTSTTTTEKPTTTTTKPPKKKTTTTTTTSSTTTTTQGNGDEEP